MSFYQQLQQATLSQQQHLASIAIIQRAVQGQISIEEYAAFLQQAYHHVKHTVPLLMATGARLSESHNWLRTAVAEYIEEEIGHEEWILNDLQACGCGKTFMRNSQPSAATELMVAYAYDMIARINPLGFFGMVHVLEGTSIRLADQAASAIQQHTQLPAHAFSYLRSHGALDIEHTQFFAGLMDRIEDQPTQQLIIHAADRFFYLYGNIFRDLQAIAINRSGECRHAL
jgi:pyrroloquinoline quinone (PQQ) biosynthesis protein C